MASGYFVGAFGETFFAGVSEAWTLLEGSGTTLEECEYATEDNQRRLGIQNTFIIDMPSLERDGGVSFQCFAMSNIEPAPVTASLE